MEAIDDYAKENHARSLAYTVLEYRKQREFGRLFPFASQELKERVHFLKPTSQSDADAWNPVIQWQMDDCPQVIETVWADNITLQQALHQKPVYYKQLDAQTLQAVIEFASQEKDGLQKHYIVVLLVESGDGDSPELKYHNTKELTQAEWDTIVNTWYPSLEEADRAFLAKMKSEKSSKNKTAETSIPNHDSEENLAPAGYWGDSASDEEPDKQAEPTQAEADDSEDDDSDDGFYARWSKDPGTLTPGIDELRTSQSSFTRLAQEDEMKEEYDQSYNPLFTVPSVPNLMDAHTSALAELTQMLQTSLPNATRSGIQPMTQINPLPKAMARPKKEDQDPTEPNDLHVPGAYPESRSKTPPADDPVQLAAQVSLWDQQKRDTGRTLLMKSLRGLVGVGRVLGFSGPDILDMVQDIVNEK